MRCFVAIPLPDDIKDYLFDCMQQIGNQYASVHWVPKKNLHMTLRFFGELTDDDVLQVKQILQTIHFSSFHLQLTSLGVFPSFSYVRVVWVGLEPLEQLRQFYGLVDSATLGIGERTEQRFEGHITLGRVKRIKKKEEFVHLLEELPLEKHSFVVDSFVFYSSVLSKDGARYSVVERYSLD